MSGQPNRNPMDPSKFREQYIANLALRAKIDDIDLQANKMYAKTQQTPSQLTDTRTVSEKYADIEGLKRDVRSKLSSVSDGTTANAIVEQLDPDELRFVATQIEQILADVKLKFKYGIIPDIFIPYLRRYMEREQQTLGVSQGLQQSTGENILLGIRQIVGGMLNDRDLNALGGRIEQAGERGGDRGLIRRILAEIAMLRATIPDADTLQQINAVQNADLRFQIQQDLNLALQNIPTRYQMEEIIITMDNAQQLGDKQRLDQILSRIQQLLAVDPGTIDAIRGVEQSLLEAVGKVGSMVAEGQSIPGQRGGFNYIPSDRLDGLALDILKPYAQFLYTALPGVFGDRILKTQITNGSKSTIIKFLKDATPTIRRFFGLDIEQEVPGGMRRGLSSDDLKAAEEGRSPTGVGSIVSANTTAETQSTRNPEGDITGFLQLKKPGGNGLKRHIKGRGIMAEHTDYTAGITPNNRYVPFGKFLIHNHKLTDNIVSLRRPAGSNISELPSQRVSQPLGSVIRKIVGGGSPSFDELHKLSDDDRRYLHTISKKSNLLDKVNVPTPSKDLEQAEINKFEIMRGELMSGNDNRDFIRDFKLLLVKLTSKGLLPSRQSKEILMELATMGY